MSLARLLGAWLLLAVVMSANGVFREVVLDPAVGPATADVISAALGIALILAVTRLFFRPLAGAPTAELLRVSAILVALTVAFEFVVGRTVDHKSWSELVGNYALWRGRLWPVVLSCLALTPFLWGRWARPGGGRRVEGRA